jgi:hypothetical protein
LEHPTGPPFTINSLVAGLPYLSGQAFEPDMIRSMSLALERACEEMGLRPGKDDPATRFVAEKIIKFAQRGIRDPDRLVTLTLQEFRSES